VLRKLKPVVMKGMGLLEKGKEKVVGAGKRVATAVAGWLGVRKNFTVRPGEGHTLYFDNAGRLMMASETPVVFEHFLGALVIPEHKEAALQHDMARVRGDLRMVDAVLADETLPEQKKREALQHLLMNIAPVIAELMRQAGGALLKSEDPQYGGLYGGFGSAMRVRIVDGHPTHPGSKPSSSLTNANWESLKRRKTSRGGRDTYYVRAHLLNDRLGGPGDDWRNLSILSQRANVRDWYGTGSHEGAIESRLKGPLSHRGKAFIYIVTASYGRSPDAGLLAAIDDLIRHRMLPRSVRMPDSPMNLMYLQSYSLTELRRVEAVVSAEEFVPNAFVCTIKEIDPSDGTMVSRSDHNLDDRAIPNDIGGQYFV
jgi:hypothetical protein